MDGRASAPATLGAAAAAAFKKKLKTDEAAAKALGTLAGNLQGKPLELVYAVAELAAERAKSAGMLISTCKDRGWLEELVVDAAAVLEKKRAARERDERAATKAAADAVVKAQDQDRIAFLDGLKKKLASVVKGGDVVTVRGEGPYRLTKAASGSLMAKLVSDDGKPFSFALALEAIVVSVLTPEEIRAGLDALTFGELRKIVAEVEVKA